MSLKHDEGWNVPFDCPFYPPLPAIYRNMRIQYVFFYSTPEAVARYLPEPLTPSADGLCVASGLDVPFCTHYGPFQESFLLLKCQFRGQAGFYCSHVFHNGPAGIAAGREIYGTPKVYADVRVRQVERAMVTETYYGGSPVLHICSTMDQTSEANTMPALRPSWRLKIIPRADGPGPAIKQLIDCAGVNRDATVHFQAKGQGKISLGSSPLCDLSPLTPVHYGPAYYQEVSFSEGFAEIVYDYLAEKGTHA